MYVDMSKAIKQSWLDLIQQTTTTTKKKEEEGSHSGVSSAEFPSTGKNREMSDVIAPPTAIHCLTGAHESGVYLLAELMIHCTDICNEER
ncbi:hypothetical protein ACH3XW_37455 [Acanthocheilonema viteae]